MIPISSVSAGSSSALFHGSSIFLYPQPIHSYSNCFLLITNTLSCLATRTRGWCLNFFFGLSGSWSCVCFQNQKFSEILMLFRVCCFTCFAPFSIDLLCWSVAVGMSWNSCHSSSRGSHSSCSSLLSMCSLFSSSMLSWGQLWTLEVSLKCSKSIRFICFLKLELGSTWSWKFGPENHAKSSWHCLSMKKYRN